MIIFNEAKPKYDRLNELLETRLSDIRVSPQVSIIVDVKEIIRKFFRPDIDVSGTYTERQIVEEISSDILNIIAHYRNYFYKKGKYTSFYFLYSYSKCENIPEKFKKEYKKEYYEKYFNDEDPKVKIIKKAIKVVESVIKITPNADFIDTSDYDEFIYAKYITTTLDNNNLVLILSNDEIFTQLIRTNTCVLTLKGIHSDLITDENSVEKFAGRETTMNTEFIPLILTLAGLKKYSIKAISNTGMLKAIKYAETLAERDCLDIMNLVSLPIIHSKFTKLDAMERSIRDNYDDLQELYLFIRGDTVLFKNKLQIATKFAGTEAIGVAQTFRELNSKIFTSHPLQLDMMLKGETLK